MKNSETQNYQNFHPISGLGVELSVENNRFVNKGTVFANDVENWNLKSFIKISSFTSTDCKFGLYGIMNLTILIEASFIFKFV